MLLYFIKLIYSDSFSKCNKGNITNNRKEKVVVFVSSYATIKIISHFYLAWKALRGEFYTRIQ